MANGGISVGRLSRQILAAAFVLLLATVAASGFFVVLTYSVADSRLEAQLASGAPEASLQHLSSALLWGQAIAITALGMLTAGLFALARFLRTGLLAPLEALRRSLTAAANGLPSQPILGVERRDEIGAAARAGEKLRQAAALEGGTDDYELRGLKQLVEHLSKDAGRLEADLARLSTTTIQTCASIEDASMKVAKASQAAIEAAGIVRDGAQRMTIQAEDSVAVLTAAIASRSLGWSPAKVSESAATAAEFAGDTEAALVLSSLADDLEALERFAQHRRSIASESAAAVTVALVEAIDRLNGIADRISATADLPHSEAA